MTWDSDFAIILGGALSVQVLLTALHADLRFTMALSLFTTTFLASVFPLTLADIASGGDGCALRRP